MDTINFFLESAKNFDKVGTLFPSSRVSASKMTAPVDFNKAMTVVELGGGTGVITRKLLAKMRPDARLITFEINPSLAKTLKGIKDERLEVVNDSVSNMSEHLSRAGVKEADCVISTLPLVLFDEKSREKILETVKNLLLAGGLYVQIQYSLFSKKEIKKKFSKVRVNFTPFNIPPAFFYICER